MKGEVLGEERLKGSTAESADTSSGGTVLSARLGVSLGGHLSAGLYPWQPTVRGGGRTSTEGFSMEDASIKGGFQSEAGQMGLPGGM